MNFEMKTHQRTKSENNQPAEPAVPCADCRCPTFWRSAYGGPLRCAVCEPWPSLEMVGERWTICKREDGTYEWVPCLRNGERAVDRVVRSSPDAVDGVTWQNVDDETGSWVVVLKVHTKARLTHD